VHHVVHEYHPVMCAGTFCCANISALLDFALATTTTINASEMSVLSLYYM